MEYLVLARKWRPQCFADVVGQEHVARTLSNAILQNRIAHAFIFSGPRGVGKTSVARILAKALNCEQGPTPTPCQICTHCREITAGAALDVREIDGASNRGIDEIRELRENVKFSPASCKYKIYIIDEVHMLTREAFNALLKTLEEPPAHVVFMFATTELQKVPATILSRCQCYDFRMIPLKQISSALQKIAESEQIRISARALNWIAQAGSGSMRDAQSVFDQIISYAGSDVTDAQVEEALSLADRRFVFQLSQAVLERNTAQCLRVINDGYYAGLDMKYFYRLLLNHFRDLLFLKVAGKDHSLFDLTDDDLTILQTRVVGVSRDALQKYLDLLLAEEESMRRTQEPRLLLEAAVVRMACLEEFIPLDEVLGRMEQMEKRLKADVFSHNAGNGNEERENAVTARDAAPISAGPPEANEQRKSYHADADRLWQDYTAYIKKQSSPLWSKIREGRLLGYEHQSLRIGFSPEHAFIVEYLREKPGLDRLMELSSTFFGERVGVVIEKIEPTEGEAAKGEGAGAKKNNHTLRQEALNHPFLQKVLDVFEGAEVREIIPRKRNEGVEERG